jgi:adenylyltransferase/sulfurtransferase
MSRHHGKKTPEEKLAAASALVVGAGGLGSAAILGLARAGIGRIAIVDADVVDESNLHRQVLFGDAEIGRPKATAAQSRLAESFPRLAVEATAARFAPRNAWDFLEGHDVVVDGTDDPATKFLLNDLCVLAETPLVTASAVGLRGYVLTVEPGRGPCMRCLFEGPPAPEDAPGCDVLGVLGPVPGVLGALEAVEAVKAIVGGGTSLSGRLLSYEGVSGTFRMVEFDPRPDCAVCGDTPTIRSVTDLRGVTRGAE